MKTLVISLFVILASISLPATGPSAGEALTSPHSDATVMMRGAGTTWLGIVSSLQTGDRAILASCCKICRRGKACGNSCISRSYTCHRGPGCACNGN